MKNNKGFTLVELVAVLLVLSLIALITTPKITAMINKAKDNLYDKQIGNITKAAKKYTLEHPECLGYDIAKIKISDLVESGLLKENVKNPKNNEDMDGYVMVSNLNNKIEYIYYDDSFVTKAKMQSLDIDRYDGKNPRNLLVLDFFDMFPSEFGSIEEYDSEDIISISFYTVGFMLNNNMNLIDAFDVISFVSKPKNSKKLENEIIDYLNLEHDNNCSYGKHFSLFKSIKIYENGNVRTYMLVALDDSDFEEEYSVEEMAAVSEVYASAKNDDISIFCDDLLGVDWPPEYIDVFRQEKEACLNRTMGILPMMDIDGETFPMDYSKLSVTLIEFVE